MINRKHALPLSQQARELGISRGSIYYDRRAASNTSDVHGRAVPASDLLEKHIRDMRQKHPYFGRLWLSRFLDAQGVKTTQYRVSKVLKEMATERAGTQAGRGVNR